MPAPIKWTVDFDLINAENPEGHPWLSASPDGRFSLLFFETLAGPPVQTDIEERVFTAAGTSPVSIGTTFSSTTVEGQPASAYMADGRRVIVWTEAPTAGGGNLQDVYATVYYGNNVIDLPRFLVTGGASTQLDPVVAASGTGFVIALNDGSVAGGQLVLKFFNIAGTLINTVNGADAGEGVNQTNTGAHRDVEITALTNGNYVVTWADVQFDIFARVFSAGGIALSGILDVDPGGAQATFPDVTALADGRFVVTYGQFSANTVRGHIYEADGTSAGNPFTIGGAALNALQQQVQTAALQDGRFVTVWVTTIGNIVGQMVFADGALDGAAFAVNSDGAGGKGRPTIATLADGRFAVSWESGAGAAGTIFTTIFDPREAGINLVGTTVADDYIGSGFADTIATGAGNDRIDGVGGNDKLYGGTGADTMTGGDGSDTYFADVFNDLVTETNAVLATGGDDLVNFTGASGTFTLGTNVERLTLGGTSAINGTGNALANKLTGNGGSNILTGLAGKDTINGGSGGADTLIGGLDDDIYVVRNAAALIDEIAGGGTADRVQAAVDYVLAADDDIEFLTTISLAAVTTINLTGNALAQRITGNAGANRLSDGGGAGIDTLSGGAGDDTYVIDNSATLITESVGAGTADRVLTGVTFVLAANDNIEFLRTTSPTGSGAIDLTGNALAQNIMGNDGINRLNGLTGSDTLTGGLGADTFVFTAALGAGNIDRITDYTVAADTIELKSTQFGNLAVGVLDVSNFVANAAGTAADALDRIIYDTTNGFLYFDADGSGAGFLQQQFATLSGAPAGMTFAEFNLV